MNQKIHVTNNTQMPMYVGAAMIPPGETRHFDPDHVPPHLRQAPPEPEAAESADPIAVLSQAKVADIKAAITGLSDADLERLGDLEQAKGETARKGVLEAVAEETLRRAEAKTAGGGEVTGGNEGGEEA